MGLACPCLKITTAATIVGTLNFLFGPIAFLLTTQFALNPQIKDKLNGTTTTTRLEILKPIPENATHPYEYEPFHHNNSELQLLTVPEPLAPFEGGGLVLDDWITYLIYYPPILITFLIGLQLLIAVHQRNECVAKLALVLNYILLGLLLVLTMVMLAHSVKLGSIAPFIAFIILQSYFLWIVFSFLVEIRHPRYQLHSLYEDSNISHQHLDEDLRL